MDLKVKIKRSRLVKIFGKIAKGRTNALKEFYELYGNFIMATAMSICRSLDNADYVLNEVLIKIWQTADYLPKVDNFDGWLYRVTVNTAKDLVRADNWSPLGDTVLAADDFARMTSDDEFFWLIDGLAPLERDICVCKFIADMTFAEIAATTDKPVSTVSSAYYRALSRIKEKLSKNNK